ncbi:MAG: NAD(P)H-hydrate epimerase [Chloroflexi bacterium]|nr:NAD(P)H-hydrate epimerase [Chloroflexota bacterium]
MLGYPSDAVTAAPTRPIRDDSPLPADDPALMTLDLRGLRRRWAATAARSPIGAEAMAGTDLRAQAFGMSGERLMEHAGAAVAAATRALAEDTGRLARGPILVLCGSGNNGGDGLVAARYLAAAGLDVVVALVASSARPRTVDAARNWDRLGAATRVTRVHATGGRDLAVLGGDIDRAAVIVDALLGTGVTGGLREPVRGAVELIARARALGVPVVSVDTPTAVDLSSGDPSEPVVQADLTVTFHRPKTGLRTRRGAALAGRILVAPIGVPKDADRG